MHWYWLLVDGKKAPKKSAVDLMAAFLLLFYIYICCVYVFIYILHMWFINNRHFVYKISITDVHTYHAIRFLAQAWNKRSVVRFLLYFYFYFFYFHLSAGQLVFHVQLKPFPLALALLFSSLSCVQPVNPPATAAALNRVLARDSGTLNVIWCQRTIFPAANHLGPNPQCQL